MMWMLDKRSGGDPRWINHPYPSSDNLVHQSRLMVCVNDEGVRDLITFYDVDAWQTEWRRSTVDQSRRP